MDETETLKEGEIFCAVNSGGCIERLTGSVMVSRCPALHPGDVQPAVAVDVPEGHPLKTLHNVVVFSSQGPRDMPSMLSGGDLDGDLYQVFFDPTLRPPKFTDPADYDTVKPIDIGRDVERQDITDFFVTFMQNENLGLIATLHQILADQSKDGIFDPTCIQLAHQHSTAVDYSKTGIEVSSIYDGNVDITDHSRYPENRSQDILERGPTSWLRDLTLRYRQT